MVSGSQSQCIIQWAYMYAAAQFYSNDRLIITVNNQEISLISVWDHDFNINSLLSTHIKKSSVSLYNASLISQFSFAASSSSFLLRLSKTALYIADLLVQVFSFFCVSYDC
jgi:hypothetical protein